MKKLEGTITFINQEYGYAFTNGVSYVFTREYNRKLWDKLAVGFCVAFLPVRLASGKFFAKAIELLNPHYVHHSISRMGKVVSKNKEYATILSGQKHYYLSKIQHGMKWNTFKKGSKMFFRLDYVGEGHYLITTFRVVENKVQLTRYTLKSLWSAIFRDLF
ncbi:hypothetical protein [Campylobacter sp.]|uniref:hypothetical protein n=1 Tax=Campylobacter sp. TaxID=205 RepID=UPI0025BA8476|nr:hypothetical protein [Campylobacter sp.]